jgi:hypothetical protein
VGDETGTTGEFPSLLGSQACFHYLDGSVRVEGTDIILLPDHDLAAKVRGHVVKDTDGGWTT